MVLSKVCLFNNACRFIYNFCVINDHLEFDRNFKNKYPSELQIEMENISTFKPSFLGLSITIENKKFKTQLHHRSFFYCSYATFVQ